MSRFETSREYPTWSSRCPNCGADGRERIYDPKVPEIVCRGCGVVLWEGLDCEVIVGKAGDYTKNHRDYCDLVKICEALKWNKYQASSMVIEILQDPVLRSIYLNSCRKRKQHWNPCVKCCALLLGVLRNEKNFDISFRQAGELLNKPKSSLHRNYKKIWELIINMRRRLQ